MSQYFGIGAILEMRGSFSKIGFLERRVTLVGLSLSNKSKTFLARVDFEADNLP
jgi:hypothetical protein